MPTPRRHRVDRAATPTAPAPAFSLALILTAVLAWPACAPGQIPDDPARQVTLFGMIASPHDLGVDPKLAKIEPQLRKLLPNHGFRLLDVQSKRLTAGQTLSCQLEDGFSAATTLVQPADPDGKVQLRCTMLRKQTVLLETLVSTPPNQLFFCDKVLGGGTRLLIGIGAR
ncbi:MAG: hypothetical protein LC745_01465 [Planctomycetia bacterium]|nr:hypothetical protein [Planctomycetia bacterium]